MRTGIIGEKGNHFPNGGYDAHNERRGIVAPTHLQDRAILRSTYASNDSQVSPSLTDDVGRAQAHDNRRAGFQSSCLRFEVPGFLSATQGHPGPDQRD